MDIFNTAVVWWSGNLTLDVHLYNAVDSSKCSIPLYVFTYLTSATYLISVSPFESLKYSDGLQQHVVDATVANFARLMVHHPKLHWQQPLQLQQQNYSL